MKDLKELSPMARLKELDPVNRFIFFVLRSVCSDSGEFPGDLSRLQLLINGADVGTGRLSLTIRGLNSRLGYLTYIGILSPDPQAEPNEKKQWWKPRNPITVSDQFIQNLFPKMQSKRVSGEEYELLQEELERSEALREEQSNVIARLRKQLRQADQVYTPTFKMVNKDGSPNKQAEQFRRVWAWLVLLGVDQAFVKSREHIGNGKIEMTLDYRTFSLWISRYGLGLIEGVCMNLYTSGRLDQIKEKSDDRWKDSVVRYLHGAFKKTHEEGRDQSNGHRNNGGERYEYTPPV